VRIRALLLSTALLLTGCSPVANDLSAIDSLEEVMTQQVVWTPCEGSFECAEIAAPLDWLNPTDNFITLAMMRDTAASSKPAIFVNPGGPGVSAIKWMREGYESIGSADLRSSFQLVAFDPRGVGESSAVSCSSVEKKDQVYYGQSPYPFGSAEDIAYSRKVLSEFALSCQESGFDVAYFNTQQAARDLELMRELVGGEKLDYLGFSYGTLLGSTYAALFPDKVGRLVLDGAIDPLLSEPEMLLDQVSGFDKAFRAYLQDCLGTTECPFKGSVDQALIVVEDFLKKIETTPLQTQVDRKLTINSALSGIFAALYSQDSWQYLTQAFQEALTGDGTTMLLLADYYNDRDVADGYMSNLNEANLAISCADSRITEQEAIGLNDEFLVASEVFGKYFAYPSLGCESWPDGKSKVKLDFTQKLASAPLVIGTTGDPATPYEQAVALSELLDGAVLLTFEGEGHTAYGSNVCVDAIVEAYFRGEDIGTGNKTCAG
jgi:pimeloyl-ACP methyl ester carboxylesterase